MCKSSLHAINELLFHVMLFQTCAWCAQRGTQDCTASRGVRAQGLQCGSETSGVYLSRGRGTGRSGMYVLDIHKLYICCWHTQVVCCWHTQMVCCWHTQVVCCWHTQVVCCWHTQVVQRNLSKVVTVYGSHLSKTASPPPPLAPDSTKALESISVEQPSLYKGQLQQAHRQLVVLARFHCIYMVGMLFDSLDACLHASKTS